MKPADGQHAIAPELAQSKRQWHRSQRGLSFREKVQILLELQRDELPLVRKQRPLKVWERPWPIEP